MLHWKNKPIDQLSKRELQAALAESVGLMLNRSTPNGNGEVASIFILGLVAGAAVSFIGNVIIHLG